MRGGWASRVVGRWEKGRGAVAEFPWEVGFGDGEVEADAEDGPAVLGARLYEDAGELPTFEVDVVGPLDLAVDAGTEALGGFADGERDGEGEDRVARFERTEDRRVEERRAGRRRPRPPLPSPSRRLLIGGDHGPVRRARRGELTRNGVRRPDACEMTMRGAEARRWCGGLL